eukprot:NODE_10719_length_278_cov_61.934498_g8950_i0.p3 GENE.NODE_10719_length_278_cov_61.934498_g8950_i0~~NODE_10719_length_278_cov_61.934498_g8950_i0.p3  ORF type:complete len:59 (-),score=21.84 NODE_10719_length_278_cov_61.934498_g8950_i0:27-203(-)
MATLPPPSPPNRRLYKLTLSRLEVDRAHRNKHKKGVPPPFADDFTITLVCQDADAAVG